MEFDYIKDITNELKLRREQLRISKTNLAKAMNVDRITIYNWENGKSYISIKNLLKICKLLNLDIEFKLVPKENKRVNINDILNREDEELMKIIGDNSGL